MVGLTYLSPILVSGIKMVLMHAALFGAEGIFLLELSLQLSIEEALHSNVQLYTGPSKVKSIPLEDIMIR